MLFFDIALTCSVCIRQAASPEIHEQFATELELTYSNGPASSNSLGAWAIQRALAAYQLAVLPASEEVENAFSTLVKRKEQASVLAQGVHSLGRARGASFGLPERRRQPNRGAGRQNLLRASDARTQA